MVPAIQLKDKMESKGDYLQTARNLNRRWRTLCDRYLPLASEKSIWRFSRLHNPQDQEQGWKIHIAATVLSAGDILERIGPLLSETRYLFKGAASLQELAKINSGLFYGFSQVGKCITVYPNSREDAVELAAKLYTVVSGLPGPAVPYDKPYREGAPLYYRYGAFGSLEIENADGTRTSAIRNGRNEVVPDRREPGAAVPEWETDPFAAGGFTRRQLLDPAIKPYESLSQRGKGGVYKALDLSVTPARVCILKEGRRHGETDWGGRDGYWRIGHEESVLGSLRLAGIDVPRVYRSFSVPGNYYLAMEFIEGRSLQSLLNNPPKKMPVAEALRYGAHLAELVHSIHSAGWVWRDCKPLNVIVTKDGRLRPLDFEGACRIDDPDPMPWGTPGYMPPEGNKEPVSGSRAAEDLYALGASLYQLLTGKIPDSNKPAPIGRSRRHLSRTVKEAVTALMANDWGTRPSGQVVRDALVSALAACDPDTCGGPISHLGSGEFQPAPTTP
jgi:hypothetical protein